VAKALAADLKCGVVRVNEWAPRLHQAVLCSDIEVPSRRDRRRCTSWGDLGGA
jgi:hypothetical protein